MKRREQHDQRTDRRGEPLTAVEVGRIRRLLATYPSQGDHEELCAIAGEWLKPWWELRPTKQYDSEQMTRHVLDDVLWAREGRIT